MAAQAGASSTQAKRKLIATPYGMVGGALPQASAVSPTRHSSI
jgi:hypothetical protein